MLDTQTQCFTGREMNSMKIVKTCRNQLERFSGYRATACILVDQNATLESALW